MVPQYSEWIATDDRGEMKVFATSKRADSFKGWEPIYVGTNSEPFYDERLNWEGRKDKMTQAYKMCLLDYDFNILSNAFIVHKPGIKDKKEARKENSDNERIIENEILPEMKNLYGERLGCK